MANNKFDSASLVLIPSGKKVGKLYAQKPHTGLGDFEFVRASTATYVAADGLIDVAAINEPRIDYYPSQTRPSILLEKDSTNLSLYSADITNAAYGLIGATVTPGFASSPMRNQLADKLVEDTSTGGHRFVKSTALGGSVDSSPYCISLFVKASGRHLLQIFDNNQNTSGLTVFDLSTGTVVSGTGKIELYGNGYYRCTIFTLKNFSTTSSFIVRLIDAGTNTSYTGDGVSGVLAFGMQVATSITSYIPTVASTVTRAAEILSLSAATALIGQTEGTIFVEVLYDASVENRAPTAGQPIITVGTDINNLNAIYLQGSNDGAQSNRALGLTINGGVTQALVLSGVAYPSGVIKMAYPYAAGSFKLFVNGGAAGEELSGTVPAAANIFFVNFSAAGALFTIRLRCCILYKTALSDDDAILITSI